MNTIELGRRYCIEKIKQHDSDKQFKVVPTELRTKGVGCAYKFYSEEDFIDFVLTHRLTADTLVEYEDWFEGVEKDFTIVEFLKSSDILKN